MPRTFGMSGRSDCRNRGIVFIFFIVILGIYWSNECSDRTLANTNIFADPDLDALVG
jgi:hypothetical protein